MTTRVLADITCGGCGVIFRPDRAIARYCSQVCAQKRRVDTGWTTTVCARCGVGFSLTRTRFRLSARHFCTKACWAQRGTDQSLRWTAAYAAWRTAVFKRDNYTCQSCGERGGVLNADHLACYAHHPDRRLDVSNGRTLCQQCHRQTPSYGPHPRSRCFGIA